MLAASLAGVGAALVPAGRAAAEPGAGVPFVSDGAGQGGRRLLNFNHRIGGYFLWVFEDYGTNDVYPKSGAVDIDRYPKYCYRWLKSM
ncbi:hypothetical protein ACFCWV_33750 [Streptomyces sp. NPDC056341]|uniref:hypothetical protein n=2 Tax=Streptomyces TaxID=1883 RepID=UPI0035DA07C2